MPANENRIKTYKNKGRDVDVSIYQTDERINCFEKLSLTSNYFQLSNDFILQPVHFIIFLFLLSLPRYTFY